MGSKLNPVGSQSGQVNVKYHSVWTDGPRAAQFMFHPFFFNSLLNTVFVILRQCVVDFWKGAQAPFDQNHSRYRVLSTKTGSQRHMTGDPVVCPFGNRAFEERFPVRKAKHHVWVRLQRYDATRQAAKRLFGRP